MLVVAMSRMVVMREALELSYRTSLIGWMRRMRFELRGGGGNESSSGSHGRTRKGRRREGGLHSGDRRLLSRWAWECLIY